MNATPSDSKVSAHDQQAVAFAFLSYLGEESKGLTKYDVAVKVLNDIRANIPKVPQLTEGGAADWKIVWGPAFEFDLHDQKNMMFVVQQISEPANYFVVLRGTNFHSLPNWVDDDLEVGKTVAWNGPDGQDSSKYGSISKATSNDLRALLSMAPLSHLDGASKLPGAGTSIATFLASCADQPINVTFCGHSLAGATSPTLALYFAQSRGRGGIWDPDTNAAIQVTAFAGPTPGDSAFAGYLSRIIPDSSYARYHNLHDVVPMAWNTGTFEKVPSIYEGSDVEPAVEPMTKLERDGFDFFWKKIEDKDYTQAGNSTSFTFPLETGVPWYQSKPVGTSYAAQIGYQHHASYPTFLEVPKVLEILA